VNFERDPLLPTILCAMRLCSSVYSRASRLLFVRPLALMKESKRASQPGRESQCKDGE